MTPKTTMMRIHISAFVMAALRKENGPSEGAPAEAKETTQTKRCLNVADCNFVPEKEMAQRSQKPGPVRSWATQCSKISGVKSQWRKQRFIRFTAMIANVPRVFGGKSRGTFIAPMPLCRERRIANDASKVPS
ncbi:hypothetical protein ACVWY5_001571 [Bradyrhizobium sp. USDA 3256]